MAASGSVAARASFASPPGSSELQPVETLPAPASATPASSGCCSTVSRRCGWTRRSPVCIACRWDGQQARFERISARHGIVNRPFGGNLLEDRRGRIWTQMHVYDPASDRLDELTAADGADLGTGWFLRTDQDDRWPHAVRWQQGHPGGPTGTTSMPRPTAAAADLRADHQRATPSAAGILDGLRLAPEQRSFSLAFAALDYSDPGRVRYAYQLQGFDPDWIDSKADSRVASYSNLDPGDYLLRVRASNRSGAWSPHELAIPVHVLPAWWQSWWFRLSVLVLLLLMV
jgi:hypothetical protein